VFTCAKRLREDLADRFDDLADADRKWSGFALEPTPKYVD